MDTMKRHDKIIIRKKVSWMDPSDFIYKIIIPCLIWLPQQVAEVFRARPLKRLLTTLGLVSQDKSITPFMNDCLNFTSEKISEGLELIQAKKAVTNDAGERRIVIFFAWLTAKPRHINKFAKLMADLGLDMLVVRLFPLDAMQPSTGTQVVAEQVCNFLRRRKLYEKYLVFGCSGGAYLFCEVALKVHSEPELKRAVFDKVVGQVYDSPVDLRGVSVGIAHSITSSSMLQCWIRSYVDWFLKARYDAVTRHYERAAQQMYRSPVHAPCLYLFSDNDPMSPEDVNEGIANLWRDRGLSLRGRKFHHKTTGHCLNYVTYPQEYREEIYKFFVEVGFVDQAAVDEVLKA
ncbi:Protein of unknown function DUF829 TMEM53 [Trinorchestia longiramus]|nr:Protein of unknown function DUF829 TMEM53 [Trinorchestia longiramus]